MTRYYVNLDTHTHTMCGHQHHTLLRARHCAANQRRGASKTLVTVRVNLYKPDPMGEREPKYTTIN